MDTKETKPENQEPKSFLQEMILEDFKTIESNADMIIELIQIIHRRAKQARQVMEIRKQRASDSEEATSKEDA